MKIRYAMAIPAATLAAMVLLSGCRREPGTSSASGVGSAGAAAPPPSTSALTVLASAAVPGGDVDTPPPFVPPKLTPEEMAERLWTCTNNWWTHSLQDKPVCQWALVAWAGGDLGASAKKYKADCDNGNGIACVLSISGYYLEKSPFRSRTFELAQDEDAKLLIKACELGAPMACTRVAHAYPCVDDTYGTDFGCHTRIAGFLRRKGIVGVLAMLDPLCTKGDSRSCQMLGGFLGIFSSQRHENADAKIFGYYERGCEIGDQDACRAAPYTANRLFDEATKTSKLRRLAEREIAIKEQNCLRFGECGWVARAYLAGEGVVADAAKARGYFARTCAYGFEGPGYCLDLAELQAAGKGGPVNAEAARKVYEKECSVMMDGGALESYQYENMAHGCRGLARLYQEGLGVPKDEKRAYEILKKACIAEEYTTDELGRLCLDLARAEIDGRGAPVNLEQGIRLLDTSQRKYLMLKVEYEEEMARATALRRAAADAGK